MFSLLLSDICCIGLSVTEVFCGILVGEGLVGLFSVVALDWVNSSTVKEHKSVEIHVKLVASGIDSVERVRAVLQSNNFDVKEISLK